MGTSVSPWFLEEYGKTWGDFVCSLEAGAYTRPLSSST